MIATASVPNVVSSSPAATAIRTSSPCTISAARPTAARASARLCETTTIPVIARPQPHGPHGRRDDQQRGRGRPGSWWPTLRSPR